MPASDSPAVIVAQFLKANHYNKTLEAFLKEAGLSEDAANTSAGDWTIEKILEEKKQYDSSLHFEKKAGNENQGWSKPAPEFPAKPGCSSLSNVLCVAGDASHDDILVTGADQSWRAISGSPPYSQTRSLTNSHGSPILSIQPISNGLVLSTSMSGKLMLHSASGVLLDECRHHLKYAVQVSCDSTSDELLLASAGWDQKIFIYNPNQALLRDLDPESIQERNEPCLPGFFGEPIHTIELLSNPESMLFVRHPDTTDLYLVFSRRDSTHLYYYLIKPSHGTPKYTIHAAGRQNLAPHSNAWVSFTPSCLAHSPLDPTLLAVATSHLPHMKFILVRLLFPGTDSSQPPTTAPITQVTQARAALATQDREDAAISLHVSTLAPQTPYSTPQVVWRPDGTGVFVNGDDGVIRGIEVQSGKVVAILKGHEAGTKVRTLWAGRIGGTGTEAGREVLVSGGFDKQIFIWEAKSNEGPVE